MSTMEESNRRRRKDSGSVRSAKKGHEEVEDILPDLSSDIKGIISALQHIREKAEKDGQKKNEETISSVASDLKSMIDDTKGKLEKERQNFIKVLSKSSKECELSLKNEATKFQGVYEKFCKEKVAHLQNLKEIFTKFEGEREKLLLRYEQQRKREKSMLCEVEKACADKIVAAEGSLKRRKQDDKSFSILRKSLGSFLESVSDDDFVPDE